MSPKHVLHRIYVCLVILTMLAAVSGCGPDTPTAPAPGGGQGAVLSPTPAPTATPAPTNTPVPTPTPTEIPIILPTPTPVSGPQPIPTGGLLPPTIPPLPSATPSPTITPTATSIPVTPTNTPVPTPLPPVGLNIVANYNIPFDGYSYPGYYPAPELSTQCIAQTYLNRGIATPTPTAATSSTPGASVPPATPVLLYGVALDDYWYTLFRDRYVVPAGSRINPTAGPANASTPFSGALPPGNLGYAPTPTPNPPVPYQINNELKISSLIITDTLGSQADITYYKPELMVMWNVMNNLTRQLVDPTVDPKSYQQSYETALNDLVNLVLRLNKISRVIIGNVPDLTNMRYFQTCFNPAQLRQIQNDYNAMFNSLARKYPGRVYIARLDLLDLRNHPQWVFLGDGLRFTQLGATEVAAAFGREFQKIRYR